MRYQELTVIHMSFNSGLFTCALPCAASLNSLKKVKLTGLFSPLLKQRHKHFKYVIYFNRKLSVWFGDMAYRSLFHVAQPLIY